MKFSQSGKDKVKQQQERAKIIEVLNVENERVSRAASELREHDSHDKEEAVTYCKEIINAVNNIIAAGDWESSLFLRNVIKPLKEVSEDAKRILQDLAIDKAGVKKSQLKVGKNQLMLYVSLYCAQGDRLENWESQLRTIDSHLQGRPVYTSESDVKKVIRMKTDSSHEAYAIVLIDKGCLEAISEFDEEKIDHFGNRLETLRVGSVNSSNIVRFVYEGEDYSFSHGRLHLIED